MAISVIKKDGRKWSGNSSPDKASVRYQIVPESVGSNESMTYTGIPSYGSAHPHLSGLYVDSFDFEEGQGAEKGSIVCVVNYARRVSETGGSGETAYAGAVEEWGWDGGTEEKELVTASDGTSVLNSAGDPFDAVPQVSSPAPVFTKVMKFSQRQSGAMAYNCKVNSGSMTIGDMSCPQWSLLCTVSEKRIFGDADFKYRYTIQFKFKSNKVKIAGSNAASELGWHVAITDAGMREKGEGGKMKLIRQIDPETGKRCTVTSAELLNGQGKAITRDSSGANPTPYNIKFEAYESTSFPSWFYSEPT